MITTTAPPTRRAKRRQETLDEIRELALAQLAEVGPSGLNLRAIARSMGMSSAGIYRYFESRDDLLVALIADGFGSLGSALHASTAASSGSALDRLVEAFRAYRRWAHEQPQMFALLFTDPVPNFHAPAEGPTDQAVRRALSPLVRLGAEAAGVEVPEGEVAVARQLPPQHLSDVLGVWASVHGFVCLEVFHHFDWADVDLDDVFERHVAGCVERLR